MNAVIKRPKMTIALALLAALVVDCIIGLCFNVRFMTLAAGTCIWVGIVVVLMFAVRVIVRLKDKHISFKKYNLAKPIRRVSADI